MASGIYAAYQTVQNNIARAPILDEKFEVQTRNITTSQVAIIALATAAKNTKRLDPATSPTRFDNLITQLRHALPGIVEKSITEIAIELASELDKVYGSTDIDKIRTELDDINTVIANKERAAGGGPDNPEGTVTASLRENRDLNTAAVLNDINGDNFTDSAKDALRKSVSTLLEKNGLDWDKLKRILIEKRLAQATTFNEELHNAREAGKYTNTKEACVKTGFWSVATTLGLIYHKKIASMFPENYGMPLVSGATALAMVANTPKALKLATTGAMVGGYGAYVSSGGDLFATAGGILGGGFSGLALQYPFADLEGRAQIRTAAMYTGAGVAGLTGLAYLTGQLPEDTVKFIVDHMPEANFNTGAHIVNTGLNVAQYIKGEQKEQKAEAARQREEAALAREQDIRDRARDAGYRI